MVIILFSLFLFLLIHPLLEPETDRNKMEYIVITGGLVGNALDLGPGDPDSIPGLRVTLSLLTRRILIVAIDKGCLHIEYSSLL